MDKDKIVGAFDAFVDEKYADSEEILRTQLKQAVNDFLKSKLQLKDDPIQTMDKETSGNTGDTEE